MFVVFHSISLFVYAAPTSIAPQGIKKVLTPYVYPLFDQSWSLFAPCPTINGKLKINIQYENGETGWFYPNEEAVEMHRIFRGTHHGEIALLELNLIYWVMIDKVDFNLKYDEIISYPTSNLLKDGHAYILLRRFAYGVAKNEGLNPISADIICEINEVDTGMSGEIRYPSFNWKQSE